MTALTTAPAFSVGTMNIPAAAGQKGDLPYATVVQVARGALHQAGLLAVQETSEDEDNRALDEALPGYDHYGASSENDLMVRSSRWEICPPERLPAGLAATGRIRLSGGKAKISPARDLTYVILRFKNHPELDPFVFAGTHLIVVKKDAALDFREAARAEEMAGLTAHIGAWLTAGLNVILGLDSNWGRMPKPVPSWTWVVNDGIDKIGYANAESNWAVDFVSQESYANASDHDFKVANLTATLKPVVAPPPVVTPAKPIVTKTQSIQAIIDDYAIPDTIARQLLAVVKGE